MAAYYKANNKSLLDVLNDIFKEYGYYLEGLESLTLEGKEGLERIKSIMNDFRDNQPKEFAGKQVLVREDYVSRDRVFMNEGQVEKITLPTANVLKYKLDNGAWICMRPSGTEPKIKFYFGVRERSLEDSEQVLKELQEAVMDRVELLVVN